MVDTLYYTVELLLAGAPFVVAGVALLWLGWSATRAGAAASVAALAAALLWPGLEPSGVPGALWEGLGTAGMVAYVLFGGLLLFNVLSEGGAVGEVSRFLTRVEPDPVALALLVVMGAAPFFESVTGFGVAVIISAPILLAAGFSPLKAAVLSIWGLCVTPWGALSVGTLIGADLAGVGFRELSDASALAMLPVFPVYAAATVAMAGGVVGLRRRGLEAVVLGLVAGAGTLLASHYVAPELAGIAAGLLVVTAFLAPRAGRLRELRVPARALSPYAVLLALLVGANVVGPVREAVEGLGPMFAGPGPWLVASAAFAAVVLGVRRGAAVSIVGSTFGKWVPVAGAVVTFIFAGQILTGSGAAELLAGGAAAALGGAYPVFDPLIGGLGGAMLGSNAGSNALFMPFQAGAAAGSGSPELVLAALQNVSGSLGNLVSPQKAVLAVAATGLVGQEKKIVRAAAPPVLVSLAILALAGALHG